MRLSTTLSSAAKRVKSATLMFFLTQVRTSGGCGGRVKGHLLLNAHEKPMKHEGVVNISEVSQAKSPETQKGAYFIFA